MSNPPIPPSPAPVPPTPVNPAEAVKMPAMGLLAAGAVHVLWMLYILVSSLFGIGMNVLGRNAVGGAMSALYALVMVAISLVFAGLIIYGGLQMQKLKNYNMALAGAIVAILPCTYCCCAHIPLGVWALVILLKPEVKAAFTN